jgi:hypothetical protein
MAALDDEDILVGSQSPSKKSKKEIKPAQLLTTFNKLVQFMSAVKFTVERWDLTNIGSHTKLLLMEKLMKAAGGANAKALYPLAFTLTPFAYTEEATKSKEDIELSEIMKLSALELHDHIMYAVESNMEGIGMKSREQSFKALTDYVHDTTLFPADISHERHLYALDACGYEVDLLNKAVLTSFTDSSSEGGVFQDNLKQAEAKLLFLQEINQLNVKPPPPKLEVRPYSEARMQLMKKDGYKITRAQKMVVVVDDSPAELARLVEARQLAAGQKLDAEYLKVRF